MPTGAEKVTPFRLKEPPPPPAEAAVYKAFGCVEGNPQSGSLRLPMRLELRTAQGVAVAGFYASIVTIQYSDDGTSIILNQTPPVIVLGRNLQPVAQAIIAGICEWIAQIRDGENAGDGEPVITEIKYGKAS